MRKIFEEIKDSVINFLKKISWKKYYKGEDIKTNDISLFAYKINIANKKYGAVGKLFHIKMQSGRIGIYKCVKYEKAWNVDWGWYKLKFIKYEKD